MSPDRPNQFKILLSDEERVMLDELAEGRGLTASDYLRTCIRDEYAQLQTKQTGFGPGPKRSTAAVKRAKK